MREKLLELEKEIVVVTQQLINALVSKHKNDFYKSGVVEDNCCSFKDYTNQIFSGTVKKFTFETKGVGSETEIDLYAVVELVDKSVRFITLDQIVQDGSDPTEYLV